MNDPFRIKFDLHLKKKEKKTRQFTRCYYFYFNFITKYKIVDLATAESIFSVKKIIFYFFFKQLHP